MSDVIVHWISIGKMKNSLLKMGQLGKWHLLIWFQQMQKSTFYIKYKGKTYICEIFRGGVKRHKRNGRKIIHKLVTVLIMLVELFVSGSCILFMPKDCCVGMVIILLYCIISVISIAFVEYYGGC